VLTFIAVTSVCTNPAKPANLGHQGSGQNLYLRRVIPGIGFYDGSSAGARGLFFTLAKLMLRRPS